MQTVKARGPANGVEKHHLMGNAAMIAAVFLWGISFPVIKSTVAVVPPITMAFIRFAIASVVLLLLLIKLEPAFRLDKQAARKMAAAGFLGVTLYFIFENTGVKLTTASNAALITTVIPIIATALDVLVYRTRVTTLQCLGMLVAFGGTYLAVTAYGQVRLDSANFKGNLLIVCAMVTWALYTLYNKSLGNTYSGLFVTAFQNLFGTVFLLPLSFSEIKQWEPFPLQAWAGIVFLAIFCSAGCYFLYLYALRKLDVTVTTMYLNLVPIVGVVSGHLFLQETILPIQYWGGVIIVAGIAIVHMKTRKPRGADAHKKDGAR